MRVCVWLQWPWQLWGVAAAATAERLQGKPEGRWIGEGEIGAEESSDGGGV